MKSPKRNKRVIAALGSKSKSKSQEKKTKNNTNEKHFSSVTDKSAIDISTDMLAGWLAI